VSPGHALLVPKRHVATWFEATDEEQVELLVGVEVAREAIEREYQPDGFNVGINIGAAGGQTLFHLHVHVIPRYSGDVPDPRGGVRHVVPTRGNYLVEGPDDGALAADREGGRAAVHQLKWAPPHLRALIAGAEDPLLPHLRAHLGRAYAADMAVAFVLESGMRLLEAHLLDLLERHGRLRFLTGDYLGVTDPRALLRLLDLQEQHPERTEFRVFEAADGTFHPKSYVFHDGAGGGVALVGSSNLTRPALTSGVEWNFRTVTSRDRSGFADVTASFEVLFRHPRTRPLDASWVDRYLSRRAALRTVPERVIAPPEEEPEPPPEPHEIQQRALGALEATREEGNTAGLVVLATGLGKTWLSAFDSARTEARRVLFVAHREEILKQAMATFRRIRPQAHLGLYTGQEKTPDADVVFASILTLGRQANLRRFAPDEFDYVVVDEFHHAAARTYRRVIDYFEPKFLLGLTATPERTDGGDLLALCQENLVFRCDLAHGIAAGLLSPFRYFGVPDEVNYANIPWRSHRFDEEALTTAVATRSRAQNALEQYRARAGGRTLAFCCSKRHADFMREFFDDAGLHVAAVHSGDSSDPRATSLERLEAGELDVVFAVDMLNEGVDVPHVDTVMMLRPTESRILWLQQFGRGLRKAEGKGHLTVIDYIGNHRTFLLKPQTLFELPLGDAHIDHALNLLQAGEAELPPGCEVTYDLEAVDILRALLRAPRDEEVLRFAYEDFRERNGVRPTATELHHEGYAPRSARRSYGSWLGFVGAMEDLGGAEQALLKAGRPAEFLSVLETTPMTRSYKMLVLLAMLSAECFPGEISIDALWEGVRRVARRSAALREDVGVSLDDEAGLTRILEENPIAAWTGGKGTGGIAYFEYREGTFRTTFDVDPASREALGELARELVDWRLAEYLDRAPGPEAPSADRFVCRVSHASGRPILFLPPREKNSAIPEGWAPVTADGEAFEANFVKVAVNVMRRPGTSDNALPALVRNWFGEDAGLPGTSHQVALEVGETGLVMTPLRRRPAGAGPEIGRSYMRAEIPLSAGLEFRSVLWQQGFVFEGGQVFLLVTLDKSGMPQEHRYGDRFLAPDLFEWKSQNRHTQQSRAGQTMQHHRSRGTPVHLFVRKTGKIASKAAPFIYCGELDFVDWEGEKPITVRWRLREPLSLRLAQLFGVKRRVSE
jgi:superfamily II DNA or RNA helicase/diadenosine tetraphosphate (Ap4A) HIT family hydrolase